MFRFSSWFRHCAPLLVGLVCWIHTLPAQSSHSGVNPTHSGNEHPTVVNEIRPSDSSVENWEKLSIKDSDLHADSVVSGQTDTFPEFTRELLRVQWRKGDPVDLYIVRPANVEHPRVVLYLYGYPREAVRFLDPNFCRTLAQSGLAAVGFSSMLTGQRYHDVPMKEWFVSDLQRSLVGTTHDVQMVLNYLESRGDVDTSSVGLFGEGSGGTIALLAASVDSRVKAVDLLNPWGDWSIWLAHSHLVPDTERASYVSEDFLRQVAPLDPVSTLPALKQVPLRLQQTMWEDTVTPVGARDHIAAALSSTATLVRYTDEADYAERAGRQGRMLDWLRTALKPCNP